MQFKKRQILGAFWRTIKKKKPKAPSSEIHERWCYAAQLSGNWVCAAPGCWVLIEQLMAANEGGDFKGAGHFNPAQDCAGCPVRGLGTLSD